jgi:hypothetical protein
VGFLLDAQDHLPLLVFSLGLGNKKAVPDFSGTALRASAWLILS